ncbi:MAG: U32 family peptidase [Bacteroidota bacterium]|nr:U32 family peptidase [Bacteroidota bacterium]
MEIKRNNIEIMAPAGSFDSLHAAIQGGANSVYFGIQHLNMRAASSNNFSLEDLVEIVNICNKSKIKSYLTLNTVLYDHDVELMRKIIIIAKNVGISAIIVSDLAAIMEAYSAGIEVHISTQLNITNATALKFYSQWADVVVLARELNLSQITKIYNTIEKEKITGPSGNLVRLELFAHGALCMAVSGKCYLSLHENNASANRGACQQTCRKSYIVTEKESGYELEIDNEYIMSPKDLMTIHFLNKILEAGIRVLKIEGRARPPEYVYTVTSCYNEAVTSLEDKTYDDARIESWKNRLSTVFNRGFWDGYYLGRKLGEWSHKYGSQATRRKVYLGKGNNYFNKISVAEFIIETGSLDLGDEILITGPTTGVIQTKVSELRVNKENVEKAQKGDFCSIPIESQVRRADKLYKIVDASQIQQQ